MNPFGGRHVREQGLATTHLMVARRESDGSTPRPEGIAGQVEARPEDAMGHGGTLAAT